MVRKSMEQPDSLVCTYALWYHLHLCSLVLSAAGPICTSLLWYFLVLPVTTCCIVHVCWFRLCHSSPCKQYKI